MAKQSNRIGTGGSIERTLVRRWARRQLTIVKAPAAVAVLDALLDWLDAQPARTRRKGGLGKS